MRDRHKYKGQRIPTIKSKFPGYVAYRINGKTWYACRRHRTVERIDSALADELIMRTQTLPDVNINHSRLNCLSPCMTL